MTITKTLLTFPGFRESNIVAVSGAVADEGVFSLAVGVSTSRSCLRVAPVEVTTAALSAGKSDRLKHPRRVILLRVRLELGPCQSFDLLQNSQAKKLSERCEMGLSVSRTLVERQAIVSLVAIGLISSFPFAVATDEALLFVENKFL